MKTNTLKEIEEIDLQLAMCQSMTDVPTGCIDRLAIVRNMLEDLMTTLTLALQQQRQEMVEKMTKVISKWQKKQHKLPEGTLPTFAFGYKKCLQDLDQLNQKLDLLVKKEE